MEGGGRAEKSGELWRERIQEREIARERERERVGGRGIETGPGAKSIKVKTRATCMFFCEHFRNSVIYENTLNEYNKFRACPTISNRDT